MPDNKDRYYLNIFNVSTRADHTDIRSAFKDCDIVKIYSVGMTKKIYDLEFATKKELLNAAEKVAQTIQGQPFYVRTSLKNTMQSRAEVGDRPRRDDYERNDRDKGRNNRRDSGNYRGGRDDKWDKKPRYHESSNRTESVEKKIEGQFSNDKDTGY